jgi:hypothetical protein
LQYVLQFYFSLSQVASFSKQHPAERGGEAGGDKLGYLSAWETEEALGIDSDEDPSASSPHNFVGSPPSVDVMADLPIVRPRPAREPAK